MYAVNCACKSFSHKYNGTGKRETNAACRVSDTGDLGLYNLGRQRVRSKPFEESSQVWRSAVLVTRSVPRELSGRIPVSFDERPNADRETPSSSVAC